MPRQESNVDVNFKPKGLKKLRADWLGFAGDLVEPLALLAAGASKATAAWAGFRGFFFAKVLGPIGLLTGAAVGGLMAIKALSGGFRKMGASSAAAIESLTTQFKPLLDSLERAQSRMAEIQNFTASTPFRMPDVAAGAKTLETLSKGALSGEKGMRMVGDAAAVANISFAQSARTIGRLYDGLQSGRPVGEAAQRMQELGLLSGAARTKIEALQASGAAGNEVWKIAEAELREMAGATEELSRTVEGLNSTLSELLGRRPTRSRSPLPSAPSSSSSIL